MAGFVNMTQARRVDDTCTDDESTDDALNIFVAAQRYGDAPAVITAAQTLSFQQCANLVHNRLHALPSGVPGATVTATATVLAGDISLASILGIYAALARHQPLGIIHAKLMPSQAETQALQLAQATLAATTAVVVFTSGSTGTPRGVVLSRQALLAATTMSAAHLGWRADDRWALALSPAHVGGLNVVLRGLTAGQPVVLTPTLAQLGQALQAGTVTLASVVPTQVQDLLRDPTWQVASNVRALLLGGAAAPQPLLDAARRRQLPLLTTYGASETCGQVVTAVPNGHQLQGIGVTLPGVYVQAGTAQAPRAIVVRTPALFDGYLDDDRTQPRTEFTTSDLGFIAADGSLVVVGRSDDVIITGGENVHPSTVEQVLLATPGVVAAVVFGVDNLRWGRCVGAAIVADATFDRPRAYATWRAELAPFQRPRTLAVVPELPRTASGKLHRAAAAALAGQPIEY